MDRISSGWAIARDSRRTGVASSSPTALGRPTLLSGATAVLVTIEPPLPSSSGPPFRGDPLGAVSRTRFPQLASGAIVLNVLTRSRRRHLEAKLRRRRAGDRILGGRGCVAWLRRTARQRAFWAVALAPVRGSSDARPLARAGGISRRRGTARHHRREPAVAPCGEGRYQSGPVPRHYYPGDLDGRPGWEWKGPRAGRNARKR